MNSREQILHLKQRMGESIIGADNQPTAEEVDQLLKQARTWIRTHFLTP